MVSPDTGRGRREAGLRGGGEGGGRAAAAVAAQPVCLLEPFTNEAGEETGVPKEYQKQK